MDFITQTGKVCRTCGEEKPSTLEYWTKSKTCKGGLNVRCKVCRNKGRRADASENRDEVNAAARERYARDKEKVKAWNRASNQRNGHKQKENKRRWRSENPEIVKASGVRTRQRERERQQREKGVYCSRCRTYKPLGDFAEVGSHGNCCGSCEGGAGLSAEGGCALNTSQRHEAKKRQHAASIPKKCTECGAEKFRVEFRGPAGSHPVCKACYPSYEIKHRRERTQRYKAQGKLSVQRDPKKWRQYATERQREYRAKNPHVTKTRNALSNLKRQLRKGLQRGILNASSKALWEKWEAQRGCCVYCGGKLTLGTEAHLDHFIPVNKGGLTELSNLVWACRRCNLNKKDKIPYLEWLPPEAA